MGVAPLFCGLGQISRRSSSEEPLQIAGGKIFYRADALLVTTHISVDVQRITLNASCMTISGGRTEQLDIIAGFLPRRWLHE